jgi:hypothetical protein
MEEVQRSHFPPERQENKASEQVYVTTVIYYYIYDNSRITATPIVKTVSKRDDWPYFYRFKVKKSASQTFCGNTDADGSCATKESSRKTRKCYDESIAKQVNK